MTKWLAHTRTSLQTHIIIWRKEKISIEYIKSKKGKEDYLYSDIFVVSSWAKNTSLFCWFIFFTIVLIFMKQWQSNSKQQFTGMLRIPKCAWRTAHTCAAPNPSISRFEKIQAISNSIDWCWNSQLRKKVTTNILEPA